MKNQYNKNISYIEIDQINPSPANVREEYDNLKELADSIEQVDLINPILVTPDQSEAFTKKSYTIISGHRRYYAIKKYITHWDKIKCTVVNDIDYHRIKEIQLVENIQREDLTDYDVAIALVELWDTGLYASKKQLAQSIGKSQSYLSKSINIVENLNKDIQEKLQQSKPKIGISKLDEVSRIKDPATQKEIMPKVESGELKRDEIKDYAQFKNSTKEYEGQTHLEDFLEEQTAKKQKIILYPKRENGDNPGEYEFLDFIADTLILKSPVGEQDVFFHKEDDLYYRDDLIVKYIPENKEQDPKISPVKIESEFPSFERYKTLKSDKPMPSRINRPLTAQTNSYSVSVPGMYLNDIFCSTNYYVDGHPTHQGHYEDKYYDLTVSLQNHDSKPKQELKISPVKINDDSSFSFFLDSRDPVIYRSYYDFFHTNYSCHFDKDLVDLLKKNKVPNNKKYKITIELIED